MDRLETLFHEIPQAQKEQAVLETFFNPIHKQEAKDEDDE